ncbi:MAG TPA: TIGR00282 family metallophosphoesterase [Dehalococcoidia bacterium]|nr:TIGR00282 family metallophosphoesterase [Dehalococcoidia bacterium]
MRVLVIGDIIGKPGRRAVAALVPGLRRELALDVVVANGENAAAGRGLTINTAKEICAASVDVITSGNHIWDNNDIFPYLDTEAPVLRPANYPEETPGRGLVRFGALTVINLMGRTFMYDIDDPFKTADRLLASVEPATPVLVDMHAEATSEKIAMGWYLDGRVSAVVGTHTHVPTADQRLLPKGTAFVTDAGMCGPRDSIIGVEPEPVIRKFLTGMPARFNVAEGSKVVQFNAVVIEIDDETGQARSIERVDREWEQHGEQG